MSGQSWVDVVLTWVGSALVDAIAAATREVLPLTCAPWWDAAQQAFTCAAVGA